jgi:hypothetical protein
MRFFSLFLSVFLLSTLLMAGTNPQKRYLVSSVGEVIPIPPDQDAARLMKNRTRVTSGSSVCPDKFTFGFGFVQGTPSNFGAYPKDVMGQWFTVPATGTIDSVYWQMNVDAGAFDSLIFVRIHQSNITPTNGPGRGIYANYPPCRSWGYWPNTNDPDQGVAAFIEEATGPWVSTINPLGAETPPPAFIPFGSELWGFGGFPVQVHALDTFGLSMEALPTGVIPATIGDNFFLSFRMNHNANITQIDPYTNPPELADARTSFNAVGFNVPTTSIDYPARNWKFYEFDKGPSPTCFGTPRDNIKRGWVVRGPLSGGENSAAYRFYYVMSVASNVPPTIKDFDRVGTTFAVAPQPVQAEIEDCNPANPGGAGVAYAKIQYFVDDVAQPDIVMDNLGGETFLGEIPAYPVGSHIVYSIYAIDNDSASAYATGGDYSVLRFENDWYSIDTAVVCDMQEIGVSGTTIDPLDLFAPLYSTSGTAPGDDGGWGPISLGGPFTFFGENFTHAWMGTNGAITLSASATDTIDPNANGFWSNYNFPQTPVWNNRGDTADAGGMPRAFLAAMWADHIVADIDTNGVVTENFGRLIYGNNGDPCQMVFQFDSLGTFNTTGSTPDETTFRIVLNRCDGTIEYQYENPGNNGLDSAALVGMQLDVDGVPDSYLFLNRNIYPYETKPRAGWCVKFTPKGGAAVLDGWNMVSVSSAPNDANYAKANLFPQATSAAFKYTTGYQSADPLQIGPGYWMKFSGDQRAGGVASAWNTNAVINVQDKWNMIGSISAGVDTTTITFGGGATPASPYYGYAGGYVVATDITPGQGYWKKMNGAGTLTLTFSAAVPKASPSSIVGDGMNAITVRDAIGRVQTLYIGEEKNLSVSANYYELPPMPPAGAFDARFSATQRMVETYPAKIEKAIEFPVSVQSNAYPISVSWNVNGVESKKFELVAAGKTTEMSAAGTKVITDRKVNTFVVRLTSGNTPKVFALGQNYPNPFNPVTRFRVDVAKTSPVEVSVFDILGRRIATLLNGEREAGSYTMEWNGKDDQGLTAPTGMYFIRMTAGDFTDSKKIMLMK